MEGIGERYARDAVTGERYKLPKYTKYNDWAKQYIKDSPPKSQRSNGIFTDVKNEYEKAATPEQGSIKYDTGYNTGKHQDEISVANLLYNTYGGNIRLLNEDNDIGVKTPDYNWRGKLWELKTTSTVNATDAAVRKAVKQIQDNPAGLSWIMVAVILMWMRWFLPLASV